jgi:hypothetical protein
MKCYECGGEYIDKTDDLELSNWIIGKFVLKNANFQRCRNCGDLLLPSETAVTADTEEQRLLKEHLESLPVADYISAAEAAVILGITKQALHKHRRIKNGFVFSINHGGRTEYLRKSVELFKETEDGRFPLFSSATEKPTNYVIMVISNPSIPSSSWESDSQDVTVPPHWTASYPVSKSLS